MVKTDYSPCGGIGKIWTRKFKSPTFALPVLNDDSRHREVKSQSVTSVLSRACVV